MELTKKELEFLIDLCNTHKRAVKYSEKKVVGFNAMILIMEKIVGAEKLTTDKEYHELKKEYNESVDRLKDDITTADMLIARFETELQLVGSSS